MMHGAAGRPLLHARFGNLVAVIVGQVDRPAGGCHVDQRRHRQQDRVDRIARIPDHREAGKHAVDARCQHQTDQQCALQAPPADEKTDHQREGEQDRDARLAGLVD